jgi:hypothetical protein
MFEALLDVETFKLLVDVILDNLVDSNVFVRSMLLSMEPAGPPITRDEVEVEGDTASTGDEVEGGGGGDTGLNEVAGAEEEEEEEVAVEEVEPRPVITSHIQQYLDSRRVPLLGHLMGIITVEEVDHENICCLNTVREHLLRRYSLLYLCCTHSLCFISLSLRRRSLYVVALLHYMLTIHIPTTHHTHHTHHAHHALSALGGNHMRASQPPQGPSKVHRRRARMGGQ